MRILNEELVREAIRLAEPGVLGILNYMGATWGPKWVTGYVEGPGLDEAVSFQFGTDPKEEWNEDWGEPDRFRRVAEKKLDVAGREQMATSIVVATRPWCLEEGEFLYPGGASRDEITVTASGAKGRADEAISEILLSIIRMLAFLDADNRIQEGNMEI